VSASHKQSAIKTLLKELQEITERNLSIRISKKTVVKIEKLPF